MSKYSGPRWEQLYEALFGYEAKLQARTLWGKGENGQPRPKYAAWRDPLIRSCDARLQARSACEQRDHLVKVEQSGLEASGLSAQEAQKKAIETAAALMLKANKKIDHSAVRYDDSNGWAPIRLFAGGALLLLCLVWMHQNNLLPYQQLQKWTDKVQSVAGVPGSAAGASANDAARTGDPAKSSDAATGADAASEATKAAYGRMRMPLRLPLVGERFSGPLGNYFAGAAGLVLVFSSFLRRWLALGFSLLAAGVFAGQFLVAADARPQISTADAQAIVAAEEQALDSLTGERRQVTQHAEATQNPFKHSIEQLETQAANNTLEDEAKRIRRQIGKFQRELEASQQETADKLQTLDAEVATHKARLAAAKAALDPAAGKSGS